MPIDLRRIISEVQDNGLANEQGRLSDAARNFDFFEGEFTKYPTRLDNDLYKRTDRRRVRRVMRRIIEVICEPCYKKPPTRTLRDKAATDWLNRCYAAARMHAIWPKADQYSLVGDVAALQFIGKADEGTGDQATLVDVRLWGAKDLVVWTEPFDPITPAAVGVIDGYDATLRLRVWTATDFLTFERRKSPSITETDRKWRLVAQEANAYGVIPFAFVHAEVPTTDFWTNGPGDFLCGFNDNLNGMVDDLGDNVRFGIVPTPVARNVHPSQTLPAGLKPGTWVKLVANPASLGMEDPPEPSLEFATPPSEFVSVARDDCNFYLDGALEDIGLPRGAIRLDVQSSSAVQILVAEMPLIKRAELRRQGLADFENRAARVAAAVAAGHLRAFNHPVPPWLDATAADSSPLTLKWPSLFAQLPGAERDRSDAVRLERGDADLIDIVMENEGLSEAEAREKLQMIADRRPWLAERGFVPAPTSDPTQVPAPSVRGDSLDKTPVTE